MNDLKQRHMTRLNTEKYLVKLNRPLIIIGIFNQISVVLVLLIMNDS